MSWFRIVSPLLLLSPALLLVGPISCTNDPDCDEILTGDFAIEIFYFGSVDCSDYSGTVIRKEDSGDIEQDLNCEVEDGTCVCRGGDDFGSYEVYVENSATGTLEYAKYNVERREAPTCIYRDNDGPFIVIDDGGGKPDGGAGGAP